jgi:hypothetical protein
VRGGLADYLIQSGRVVSHARSTIHDTTTTWSTVGGTLKVDPSAPGAAGATASIKVDMRDLDAGDRLKNWKLRGDLEPDKYPEAEFVLERLEDVQSLGGEKWSATAIGSLKWRGKIAPIRATGTGRLTEGSVEAEASFTLDVRLIGVTPPKILFMKVDNEVSVKVTLTARPK